MDLDALRSLFPVTRRFAYLDHATLCPLAAPVKKAVDRLTRRLTERGGAGSPPLRTQLDRLKERLGRLMNVEAASIAVTRNTTEGILAVANGLRLARGQNVVIAAGEFPANVQPWRALTSKGVELRVAPERDGRILLDDIAALVDRQTAAVAVSFVEFATGYRQNLAALAEVCRAADALLVVDAIQGLGALRLAPAEVGVDALACGAHKWMLAAPGIGFLYVSDRALDRLDVAQRGWLGVQDPEDFLRYDQPLACGARRFETGSWDVLGAEALVASTDLILSVGIERIEERVLKLAEHVATRAAAAGLTVASPRQRRDETSGIVVLATHWDNPKEISRRLARRGVILSPRGDGLRAAPHAYNTDEELDLLVELLVDDRSGPRRTSAWT